MLDFGVVDTFYQGFTSVLVVLLWYYFLSGLFNWKSVLKILVLTFFWGVLSVFVADFILLIMVLINFASQFIQKKSGLKSIFETDFKRHSEPRLPSTAQINH
ncbi:hypothetical protein ACWWTD_01610 [Lactiplantibacillus plantarum]